MKFKIGYLLFSLAILLPGIVFMFMGGLKPARDFTGGSYIIFKNSGKNDLSTTDFASDILFLDPDAEVSISNTISISFSKGDPALLQETKRIVSQKYTYLQEESSEIVGPSVGKETTYSAVKSLLFACLGILLYIGFAFRKVPSPYSGFRFGVSAIIAMLHDALVLLGVFAILGYFFGIKVDALFVTAMLTVIGFSVHDSIVVFDRIRENLNKLPKAWDFEKIVNFSVVETLNRSLATSITVLLTLLCLYILGGNSLKNFVLALLIGIFSGTYSSIFTAAPLLVIWEDYLKHRKNK